MNSKLIITIIAGVIALIGIFLVIKTNKKHHA